MNYKKLLFEYVYYRLYSRYITLKYGLSDRKIILVLADNDPELNYYALMHIDDFMRRLYLEEVVVASNALEDFPDYFRPEGRKIFFMHVSSKTLDKFKMMYRIAGKNLRIVSLCYPEEKKTKYMVGINGVTKEDILCRSEYQLFSYERLNSYGQ